LTDAQNPKRQNGESKMLEQSNPRSVVGGNRAPDAAQIVTENLTREYNYLAEKVDALLVEARDALTEILEESDALSVGALIKRLKDADKQIEGLRELEKEPHLRSSNAVDQWFFALRDRLGKRNRMGRPGAIDVLQNAVNGFLERKRAVEEARRRAEAEEQARIARQKAQEEADARRRADEARERQERARKAETAATHAAAAERADQEAAAAQAEADLAAERAEEARISALAKPSDMSRTRGNDGVLLTQAREGYSILIDRRLIDAPTAFLLLPYFTEQEIEKALRGYAKATNYSQPLPGTEVGFRMKGVTR
jgi:flagellar biosynthesis GTPase FlhF